MKCIHCGIEFEPGPGTSSMGCKDCLKKHNEAVKGTLKYLEELEDESKRKRTTKFYKRRHKIHL